MSRRLPPLGPLRAFEAAARHGHFHRAAAELCVTPGAVSQQVKQLEDWLGTPLFERVGRGVRLNETGHQLQRDAAESFDAIELAVQLIQRRLHEAWALTVSTVPSLSARWLIPRLGSLKARLPGLDVRILVSIHAVDFAREPVDMAIRHGRGHYPGLRSTLFYRDVYVPVCSPKLLERGPVLSQPDDLAEQTLLHEVSDANPSMPEVDWAMWLKKVGARKPDVRRGPMFAYTHMAVQAALDGQGVALSPSAFVLDDLEAGRLIRPFPQALPDVYGYYLVCPEERAEEPSIAGFWSWAADEVKLMQARLERLGISIS
ncbi:MAG: transcriptional regulator GcvA [Rhodospirillales bacterium]|jgi:LysR family glycine cleavage system transcriptional activator|nr:transcriptional regulator GcvA [Rhodospirillales bacterium]